MKVGKRLTILALLLGTALAASAQGFLELPVRFYGKVINTNAGTAQLLQQGALELTFVNVADATDTSTHTTPLGRVGPNGVFSYAIDVPQRYLPALGEEELAVGRSTTTYRLTSITIDGADALPLEPEQELVNTRFDLRAQETRLDLRVHAATADSDGDGIPDWWENLHGLNPLSADDSNQDTGDSDGISNLNEFLRGTSPRVANTDPLVQTVAVRVYELGRTGVWLDAIDSDVSAANFVFTMTSISSGFGLQLSETGLANGQTFTLDDVERGRLTIVHTNRNVADGILRLQTAAGSHDIALEVYQPTATDGTDATVWLDGNTLSGNVGATVDFWGDRSGSSNSPYALTRPPTVGAGPGVNFADPSTFLSLLEADYVSAAAHTVFSVYQTPSQPDTQTLFATNTGRLEINANDGPIPYPSAETYRTATHQVVGATATTGGIDVNMTVANGAAGRSSHNRQPTGFAESAAFSPEATYTTIGGVLDPASDALSSPFAGILHELLIFPRALTAERAARVTDHLQSRWQGYTVWDYSDATHPISLQLGSGNNIIRGGWGNDSLRGGPGADLIVGGWGDDTLNGGGGADRFVYYPGDRGHDRISSFSADDQIIDLSALFPTITTAIDDHIQFTIDSSFGFIDITVIDIDLDGDGGAPDMQISLGGNPRSNLDRDRWLATGVLQAGGLRLPQDVSISVAQTSAVETDGAIAFVIERTGFDSSALDVPVALAGDAARGVDYTISGASGTTDRLTVTIAAGQSSATIHVIPNENSVTDGTRDITLYILPTHDYALSEGTAAATVILGDGPQTVSVVAAFASTTEGDDDPAVIRLDRQGPTDSSLTVVFDVLGTGQNGVDYPFIPGTITFPIGATELTIDVTPYEDQKVEPTETVELVLLERSAYAISGIGRAKVEIHDFTPRVSIRAVAQVAQRQGRISGFFLVTRTGNLDQDMIVNLELAGTASNGVDHEHVFNFVSFAPGTANVLIPVIPIGEPSGAANETLIITIADDSSYIRVNPIAATVTIVDDPSTTTVVTIAASATYASEEGPVQSSFTLSRTGPTTNKPITVNLAIDGTADNTVDYAEIPTAFLIPSGQSEVVINIIPIADGAEEQLESIVLSVLPGDDYLVGDASSGEVSIEDTDLRVTIEAEQPVATIQGPVAGRFVLRRNKGLAGTLEVTVVVSGSADAGDYAAFSNPVTFATDASEAIVEITPIDTGETNDVTVTLTIAAGSATVTIDRDAARAVRSVVERVTVTPLSPDVWPGVQAGFRLERSGDATTDRSLRLTLSGLLDNGTDYTYISPIIIFQPGVRELEVLFDPISWAEGTVTVSVSDAHGAARSRSASRIAAAALNITRDGEATIDLVAGWNLVSLPLDAPEMGVADLFGPHVLAVWEFTGGVYQFTETLAPTHAYWVYSLEPDDVRVAGRYRVFGSRKVAAGWHFVGPLMNKSVPAGISAIWAWDTEHQRYVTPDRLSLNHGYIVKLPDTGDLDLGQ